MNFQQFCKNLETKIQDTYEQGVTILEAEKLAGEFLAAQMRVSDELKTYDLDSRMRRAGVKAVRAAVYMEAATKGDKKPSDVLLQATVDMHEIVQQEQDAYDRAEVERDALERYFNIFANAHIFFRGVAKGRFE